MGVCGITFCACSPHLSFPFRYFVADRRVRVRVLDRFTSERSVWVNMRVRIKLSTLGMVTVPVRVAPSATPSVRSQPSVLGNETAVIRYDYGDPSLGTCQETIQGGNHFRYWVQNGPQRNTSAVFMAVSYEHSLQGTCSRSSVSLNAVPISC